MKKHVLCFPLSLFLAAISFLFGGCGGPELQSTWRSDPILVDGFDTEWSGSHLHYDEKSHVVIGVANDTDDMYIRISTMDKSMQGQLLRLGCTIWFDPEGGKEKRFGIHFPLGVQSTGMSMPVKRGEKPSEQARQDLLPYMQEKMEFSGSAIVGAVSMVASGAEELGIRARIGMTKGFLVYELKVPLVSRDDSSLPYVIFADKNKPVGIGFETGKMDMAAMKPQSDQGGAGPRGKGRRGGSGGMGKMGGRRGGGPDGQRPQPFELWTKVHLAGSPG